MALVLIAVSAEGLEEYEQALKAYKRAIEADESLALAWQVRIFSGGIFRNWDMQVFCWI